MSAQGENSPASTAPPPNEQTNKPPKTPWKKFTGAVKKRMSFTTSSKDTTSTPEKLSSEDELKKETEDMHDAL